ncbi:Cystathionine gamma-synthase [Rubrivivax sp. A210]|uniref:trans-sulfuration enzyme family protein n=1 Tax=Rubrivivax sp. A210 TaxID=2772301 RepID=UPI00191AAB49|nr:PLP-dependent aspartate aminotransferase family protein [Rubrivivax sp. A210]CAD5372610.1 Cystathionine gamma-synthase [Rubrivivax sp. A210]
MEPKQAHPDTVIAQALGWIDEATRAITPPVHVSSTYLRDPDNQYRSGRVYARADNPAFDQAEAVIKALEGGHQALLFASGMAAATAVFQALAPGDHVLAPRVMYWSLRNWLMGFATQWGLDVELVEMESPEAVQAALRPGRTKLVWVETPANPLWTVTDIAATAQAAHAAGALLAVDSTVATPLLTRPLALGADLVMHAATKYLNGHSDLIAGALVTRADNEHWQRVRRVRAQLGGTLGSFEAWLLLRGLRTLHLRVRAACASAQAIAEHFETHPLVTAVLYPGLAASPGHAVARAQMQGGFGGMLSVRVYGGEAAAIAVAAQTRIWKRATSLGGVESLVEHRASVEGAGTPAPADLLRLSVGVEHVADLIADLEQALVAAHAGG